jgi:GNAT superfamily N-acetyltransferase
VRSLLEQLEASPLVFKAGCTSVRNPKDWPCKRQRNCWVHAYDVGGQPWQHAYAPAGKYLVGAASYEVACGTVTMSPIEVQDTHRRQGIGTQLVQRILDREGIAYRDLVWGPPIKPDGQQLKAALDRTLLSA